jgi:hypothetical protein
VLKVELLEKSALLTLEVSELGHGSNAGDVALVRTGSHVTQWPVQPNNQISFQYVL